MTRLINITLVLITLAGVVSLMRQRASHSTVQTEFDRLSKQYGVLNVTNPDNFFVTYIEDDDPYCFRWRVYDPPAIQMTRTMTSKSGVSSSNSMSSDGGESLHLCRFRFDQSTCRVFLRDRSGSSTISFGDEKFGRFLMDHWNDLDIDVLAKNGHVEIERDQLVRLISIRVPEKLQDAFVESVGKYYEKPNLQARPILEVSFGSDQAFRGPK